MSGRADIDVSDRIDAEFGPDLPLADARAPSAEGLAAMSDSLLRCYCTIHSAGLDRYKTRGRHFQNCLKTRRAYLGEALRRASLPPEPVEEPEEPAEAQGHVYFVRCGDLVKIGFATDVAKRLRGLSTASPQALTLLLSMAGTLTAEREMHARFASLRLRGEWFRLEGALLEFLRSEGCDV